MGPMKMPAGQMRVPGVAQIMRSGEQPSPNPQFSPKNVSLRQAHPAKPPMLATDAVGKWTRMDVPSEEVNRACGGLRLPTR